MYYYYYCKLSVFGSMQVNMGARGHNVHGSSTIEYYLQKFVCPMETERWRERGKVSAKICVIVCFVPKTVRIDASSISVFAMCQEFGFVLKLLLGIGKVLSYVFFVYKYIYNEILCCITLLPSILMNFTGYSKAFSKTAISQNRRQNMWASD